MRILVTNDDSIHSPGLWSLAEALTDVGQVCVVAPDRDQSGIGTAMTLLAVLRVHPIPSPVEGVEAFAVQGTPADAVILATESLFADPFDLVVSSPLPRAVETAVAMGFAVGEIVEELWELGPGVEDEVDWDAGYSAFADAYRLGGATASYCDRMASVVRSLADKLPQGGAALAVTHGAIVEACAVGAGPDTAALFGGPAGYCEGVRISYPDDVEPQVEVLRVDQ